MTKAYVIEFTLYNGKTYFAKTVYLNKESCEKVVKILKEQDTENSNYKIVEFDLCKF